MAKTASTIDLVETSLAQGLALGITQLDAQDQRLDGRCVRIHDRDTISFASCSYLGLELDPRLKQGAIEAAERYGTQFSSSRAYLSAPQYEELESLLDRIFDGFTLVTPNTTLAHLSALPVLISEDDAAILDHQVHHTVQLAAGQLRLQGTHVELVRHGRLDLLEKRIRELKDSHRRVWHLVDGVYSMYGDFAPLKTLSWLLARHEPLHLYIDDAHGMSWRGRHGRGFALEQIPSQERVVVAVSLNKAFGAAGGALVLPSQKLRQRIKTCGGPMIFTGPIQPPMLGAAVASAKIHLSEEIHQLQQELLERIRFANGTARELDLPLVSECQVPIRYIGLGLLSLAKQMARRLLDQGLLLNVAGFPAVGVKHSGLRFMLTRHQSLEDIRGLLEAIAQHLPRALAAAGTTREDIDRTFGLSAPEGSRRAPSPAAADPRRTAAPASPRLVCQHETSIDALDADEWDAWLGDRGSFGREGLAFLERVFDESQKPENRWSFHYYVVRDGTGRRLAATFFTEALWKDDLLAPCSVSRLVEAKRSTDPYFLTSRALAMGSLLTEGDHLYLDRQADWKPALKLLLACVGEQREASGAESILLRDFPADDPEIEPILRDSSFVRMELPDTLITEVDWTDREGFLRGLSKRSRRFHREVVLPWENAYHVEVLRQGGRPLSDQEWAHLYQLYQNVKGHNLALNTFALPENILPRMMEFAPWEILLLKLRPEFGGDPNAPPQGFHAGYLGTEHYASMLVGMDYRYIHSHALYRQLLSQVVHRAEAHGSKRILFGMGSETEKIRFGAKRRKRVMYVQSHDRFHYDVLSLIASDSNLESGE